VSQDDSTASAGSAAGDFVSSPCIRVCQLDPHTGLCRGCLRSLEEISAWSRVSPDEQRQILAAVAERREAMRR
jgi:predicted Fe-S protein YdhL (DUF1289 family)